MSDKIQVEFYETNEGKVPFSIWLNSLNESKARAKIRVRLNRLRLGNFGDCKSVGERFTNFALIMGLVTGFISVK